jgi:putative membrane protein
MHRRNILTLIALGTVIPSAAFGEERRSREERLAETAERYIEDTLAVGGIALATSQLARERANHRWVKKFAEYETAEQEGVASILRSFGGRTPAEAREEGRDAKRDLRGLSGERFDDAYLEAQADGHEHLLRIQNDLIKSGRDEELQNIAKLIRGRVQEHIDLIRTIRDQLRA